MQSRPAPKKSKARNTINKSNRVKAAVHTAKDSKRLANTKRKTVTDKKGRTVHVSKNTLTGKVTKSKEVKNKNGATVSVTRTKSKGGTTTLKNNHRTGTRRATATTAKGKTSKAVQKQKPMGTPRQLPAKAKPGSGIKRDKATVHKVPKAGKITSRARKLAKKATGTGGTFG